MNIDDAIERSMQFSEIVECEFPGDYGDLVVWIADNLYVDATLSEENDNTIDVSDDNWRVRVTLEQSCTQ
jgi:hypothetical protein